MATASYQKKKKLKDQIKQFFVYFFIILLILIFATGLVFNGGANQFISNVKIFKVLKVNNVEYNYQPNSAFYYLLNQERDQYQKEMGFKLEESEIEKIAVSDLMDAAVLSDFGNRVNVRPSRAVISAYIQRLSSGGVNGTPDQGLLDFIRLEYFRNTFNNNYADVANALAPISLPEFYNYNDLINYNASAEFLYLDTTNFIKSRITDTDITAFYQKNISNYIDEVTVEDIAISNSDMALGISSYINKNGWDSALSLYKTNYIYTGGLVLKSTNGTIKRLAKSISLPVGGIIKAPQFENGVYHIDRVESIPGIKDLDMNVRDQLISDYTGLNYSQLRTRFDSDIKSALSKAQDMAKSASDFNKISAETGLQYAKSAKISPITQNLTDEKGEPIPVTLSSFNGMSDFIFTSGVNSVSQPFTSGDIFVIVKTLSHASSETNLNITQDSYASYYYFKTSTIGRDWFSKIKDQYKITVYDKDTNSMLKQFSQN